MKLQTPKMFNAGFYDDLQRFLDDDRTSQAQRGFYLSAIAILTSDQVGVNEDAVLCVVWPSHLSKLALETAQC
jgi:hypothetical protein